MMVSLNASAKNLRKEAEDLVTTVNVPDPQDATRVLNGLYSKAIQLAYESMCMCESINRYRITVQQYVGGDLIDMLQETPAEMTDI